MIRADAEIANCAAEPSFSMSGVRASGGPGSVGSTAVLSSQARLCATLELSTYHPGELWDQPVHLVGDVELERDRGVDDSDDLAVAVGSELRAPPAQSVVGSCIIEGMAVIEVVLGDITREQTDAVVTAANESLMGGGGVDGAIHRAAGPRLAEAGAAIGPCAPGDAMATPAFDLEPPVKHVIHTVGPVWEGGDYDEAEVLASCYRRCLEVADDLVARSIAFPAIATGVYGFPPEEAARIAVATVASTPTSGQHIRLVAFDEATYELLTAELARRS